MLDKPTTLSTLGGEAIHIERVGKDVHIAAKKQVWTIDAWVFEECVLRLQQHPRMKKKQDIRAYAVHGEDLLHEDKEDALEHYLCLLESIEEPIPETVQLDTHALCNIDHTLMDPLTGLLEYMDDNIACISDEYEYTRPSERMRMAEKLFVETVIDEYTAGPWEVIDSETVHFREWIETPQFGRRIR